MFFFFFFYHKHRKKDNKRKEERKKYNKYTDTYKDKDTGRKEIKELPVHNCNSEKKERKSTSIIEQDILSNIAKETTST